MLPDEAEKSRENVRHDRWFSDSRGGNALLTVRANHVKRTVTEGHGGYILHLKQYNFFFKTLADT